MTRECPDSSKPEMTRCRWSQLEDEDQSHMTLKLAKHMMLTCHNKLYLMGGRFTVKNYSIIFIIIIFIDVNSYSLFTLKRHHNNIAVQR